MQRVDLIVDGVVKNRAQKSDNPVFQRRVTAAYQKAHDVRVVASAPVTPPPPLPNPAPSVFSGRGLFTTSDVSTAAGLHAQWSAIQRDPEGDHREEVPGRLMFWQARPTVTVMQEANDRGIPYIAQAEELSEFAHALALFDQVPLHVPHALVGKVDHQWPADVRGKAVAQGWDLILEWYWNNQPAYTEPNADGYPLFRNVCFGTFASETVPGRVVTVPEYRAVWHGAFSIWDSEGATDTDRAAYNLP